MRAYCHVHNETFSVEMLSPIVCERGMHSLGHAPNEPGRADLWEYCCECQSFWLVAVNHRGATKCPVCDRDSATRYLCFNCQTLTIQSSQASSVREFFISPQGTPQPHCPACSKIPQTAAVTHKCGVYGESFTSSRSTCPFCRSQIVSTPGRKPSPAAQPAPAPAAASGKHNPQLRFHLKHAAIASTMMLILIPLVLLVTFGRGDNRDPTSLRTADAPPGMVYVAGGTFTMGDDAGDEYEKPAHNVTVNPFFIDIHEVTCAEYSKFIRATGHRSPPGWTGSIFPGSAARLPVTGIDWYDAQAYAAWAGKRLPTEQEWEFAARGSDGRRYAWGDAWRSRAANAGDSSAGRLVEVGQYPDGRSPFGVLDMIGNAWEWTRSELVHYPGARISDFPVGPRKIIRGGSWVKDDPPDWTTTFRGFALPSGGKDYSKIGFRCAKDAPQNSTITEKGN